MKNYLLFIIDSLNYSHVKSSEIELMPFCKQIAKDSIVCDNMFSQAPYTEAAVMNIYCGQSVLENGGYIRRFADAPTTIFEVMQNAGYRTYYNSFQPQCFPSSLRRGIDDLYYNVGYDLGALWSYRLGHYSRLLKNGELRESDYLLLEEIIEDNLTEWRIFVEKYIGGDVSCEMIAANNKAYDAQKVLSDVNKHYSEFVSDKRGYINKLLTEGTSHSLFGIPAYVQDFKIKDANVRKQLVKLFKPVMKKIRKKDFSSNMKNNKGFSKATFKQLGRFFKHPSGRTLKDFLKSAQFSLNILTDLDLKQRIDKNCDVFKSAPSAKTHIDHYVKWASENKDKHFACIHVDDVHNPEMFFTYDTDSVELLEKERQMALDVISKLPKSYYGSVSHDLSLRYIDSIIEYLFEQMKSKKLLDDTCIIITADHGFSFAGNPVRDSFVINLYLENYNIPCYIYNSGKEAQIIDRICTSKDIPATICDLAVGENVSGFTGHSLFEGYEYSNVMIEYCGGGCPDISRRELKIASFDKKWFVGALATVNDDFNDDRITEIYNLENDPRQLHNLVGKTDKMNIQYLVDVIKKRYEELRLQTK